METKQAPNLPRDGNGNGGGDEDVEMEMGLEMEMDLETEMETATATKTETEMEIVMEMEKQRYTLREGEREREREGCFSKVKQAQSKVYRSKGTLSQRESGLFLRIESSIPVTGLRALLRSIFQGGVGE